MAKYTIRKNRIKAGCISGFTCDDQARLELVQTADDHGIFLKGIDGARPDAEWGRLTFDVDCSEDRAYSIYLLAVNQKIREIGGVAVDLDVLMAKEDIPVENKVYVLTKLGDYTVGNGNRAWSGANVELAQHRNWLHERWDLTPTTANKTYLVAIDAGHQEKKSQTLCRSAETEGFQKMIAFCALAKGPGKAS